MKKEESLVGAAYSDLIASKKRLYTSNVLLSVGLVISLFMYINKDDKTIVLPSQITGEMVIGESRANEEYQKRFAFAVANLIGNVSPSNIDFVTDSIEEMLSPQLRSVLLPSLQNEANVLKVRSLQQDYIIRDMIWSNPADMVYVWGKKRTRNGSEQVQEDYTYEIRIKPIDGYPRIVHLKGYKGAPSKKPADHVKPDTPFYDGELGTINADGEKTE
jgi:conjugal transfer pilus assembly protein TraE